LIGLGVVVVLYLLYALSSRNFRHPSKVFEGLDGVSSTSKFQWAIWLAAILIVYVALWVIRVKVLG
jgi:energy-converting hydrogenase Eha subunit G